MRVFETYWSCDTPNPSSKEKLEKEFTRQYGDGERDKTYATQAFFSYEKQRWCVNVHELSSRDPETYGFLTYREADKFRLQFDNWDRLCHRTKGKPYKWK